MSEITTRANLKSSKPKKPELSTGQSKDQEEEAAKQKTRKFKISYKEYQRYLKHLQTKYPKCFTDPPSPLAVGIHKELLESEKKDISKTRIRYFLRYYIGSKKYQEALNTGTNRLNLDGSVASKVLKSEIDLKIKKKLKKQLKKGNNPNPNIT